MTAAEVVNHVEQFQRRVLQDAMQEASAICWRRRAEQFEWARPRPGEFHGRATREELSMRWRRLTEVAQACRARAELTLVEQWPEVDEVLASRSTSPVDELAAVSEAA